MNQVKSTTLQFSVGSLMLFTVAVAVWVSGVSHLHRDSQPTLLPTVGILAMTLALLATLFVGYGSLLLLLFWADPRADHYYRQQIKNWLRFSLWTTVAIAPWMVVLVFG